MRTYVKTIRKSEHWLFGYLVIRRNSSFLKYDDSIVMTLFLKGNLTDLVKYLWINQRDISKGHSPAHVYICLKCRDEQTPPLTGYLGSLGRAPGAGPAYNPMCLASVRMARLESVGSHGPKVAPEVIREQAWPQGPTSVVGMQHRDRELT